MLELAPQHKTGLALAGRLMNGAGTLGFAGEYRGLVDFTALGAFVTNPLTLNPRTPAHPPNAVEVPNGLLIHTGLPNPGVRRALRRHDADWRRLGVPVIVHLAATTAAEVVLALEYLERAQGVSGLELGLRDDVSAG
jgi:dihydroorotate dehydrogenase